MESQLPVEAPSYRALSRGTISNKSIEDTYRVQGASSVPTLNDVELYKIL